MSNAATAAAHLSSAINLPWTPGNRPLRPLDSLEIGLDESLLADGAMVHILDGAGRSYVDIPASPSIRFTVGGALGRQTCLVRKDDRLLARREFQVDDQTRLDDGDDWFSHFLQVLHYSVTNAGNYQKGQIKRYNGKLYTYYSSWIYDHVYGALGLQYFQDDFWEAINLYADSQRDNGMIFDNYKHAYSRHSNWMLRFGPEFVQVPEDPTSSCILVRIPVENSNEYHFIEGVYRCWKAMGDTDWMKAKLDHCLKAVEYSTTSPYRWSEKHQLLKKGYSIDMWDFQSQFDAARVGGDVMNITLEDTHFNIFYGDNGRMAQSCHYLGEMLAHVGRDDEAARLHRLGDDLKRRIDDLSWTGTHYLHMVPVDEDHIERDFGVDTTQQVTLHNAWLLNRGLTHEQCVAVLRTYQRIREQMPETSPGEWYTCYPPFERGWNAGKWEYMNGGVTPICAGELARGAFEHGFEDYGLDILRRVYDLSAETNYLLDGCYKGAIPEPPDRTFIPLPLADVANTDFRGDRDNDAIGWSQEGENDLRQMPTGSQTFEEVPFEVIEPSDNAGRACIGISSRDPYAQQAELSVGQQAGSIYLLHTAAGGNLVGQLRLVYDDGSEHLHLIADRKLNGDGPAVGGWWNPSVAEPTKGIPHLRVAWRGENPKANNVGVYLYGLNNPQPGKTITKIRFECPPGQSAATWWIIGVTLSDAEVYLRPNILSGIPRQWAAGEVMYGLFEGLIGVQDLGVGFDRVRLVPRWQAAGKDAVHAVVKYPKAGGYVAYHYRRQTDGDRPGYQLTFTGNARESTVELLLPTNGQPQKVTLDGEAVEAELKTIEGSRYAVIPVVGVGVHAIELWM